MGNDPQEHDPAREDHLHASGGLGQQAAQNQNTNVESAAERVEQAAHVAAVAAEHAAENHAITEAQLDRLATGVLSINDSVLGLAKLVTRSDQEAKDERHRHFVTLTVIVMVSMFILGTIGIVAAVELNRIAETNRQAAQTRNAIVDCVTPGRKCFQESQTRTAAIVGDPPAPINSVTVWTAVCAHQLANDPAIRTTIQDYNQIHACIKSHLGR